MQDPARLPAMAQHSEGEQHSVATIDAHAAKQGDPISSGSGPGGSSLRADAKPFEPSASTLLGCTHSNAEGDIESTRQGQRQAAPSIITAWGAFRLALPDPTEPCPYVDDPAIPRKLRRHRKERLRVKLGRQMLRAHKAADLPSEAV